MNLLNVKWVDTWGGMQVNQWRRCLKWQWLGFVSEDGGEGSSATVRSDQGDTREEEEEEWTRKRKKILSLWF